MTKIYITIGVLVVLVLAGWLYVGDDLKKEITEVSDFESCVEAGYPVLESYPRQCVTEEGDRYVEGNGELEKKGNLIQVDSPLPNTVVTSPLEVKGKAKGAWFFEGVFDVELLDANGVSVVKRQARAQGEWTMEDYVPFSANIEFVSPVTDTGTLVLRQADPSGGEAGEPAEVTMPVKFK